MASMANNYFASMPGTASDEYLQPNDTPSGANMSMLHPHEHMMHYYQQPRGGHQQLDVASPNIDPMLGTAQDGQPMERYLAESNKMYFTPQNLGTRDPAQSWARVDHSSPYLPLSTGQRHGSPFSQHFSATSSGALSPPAESDRYVDGTQGPSTPPDMPSVSPYLGHGSAQFHLTGLLAPNTTPGCVNPSYISSGSEHSAFEPSDKHDSAGNMGHMAHDASMQSQNEAAFYQRPFTAQVDASEEALQTYPYTHNPHLSLPTTPNYNDVDVDQPRGLGRASPLNGFRPHPSSRASPSVSHGRPTGVNTDRIRRGKRSPPRKAARPAKNTSASGYGTRGLVVTEANDALDCPQCASTLKDDAALQKHIKTQHNRPFVCYFQYAGCTSTFATKNEWKRHVVSQHLALSYWLCTHGDCACATGPSTHKRSMSLPTHGCIFNRKDLFTQHVRRMHAPDEAKKAMKNKKAVPMPEWDEQLKRMQDMAQQERCRLPSYMACPVPHCGSEFKGNTAWDDRMEHVARHLEKAATGDEPPVYFGRDTDPTLTQWAESPEVAVVQRTAIGWELSNPLKGDACCRGFNGELSNEDAEGEDA